MNFVRLWGFACLLTSALATCGGSNRSDTFAVPYGYYRIGVKEGVPSELLYVVALTESGRTVQPQGIFRPWPWTLNTRGIGTFFGSRHEALHQIQMQVDQGNENVDVGLMQVSLRFHRDRFSSIPDTLDPYINLSVGARILRECYERQGNWQDAVGCYHSPNDRDRANRYRTRVEENWVLYVNPSGEIQELSADSVYP